MSILDNLMQGYANKVLGGGKGENPQQTADAFQRLQQAIANDYSQQKQEAEAQGNKWEMPSASERFQDQVNAMILSGDPALQNRGLALVEAPKDERTAFQKEYEFLSRGNPSLDPMALYNQVHPGRAVTNVNVNTGGGFEGINFLSPEQKQQLNLPQNTSYYVTKSGEIKMAPGGADLATQQQTNVTKSSIQTTGDLLFGDNGLYKATEQTVSKMNVPKSLQRPAEAAVAASQVYLQNDPRYAQYDAIRGNLASSIGRAYLGEKGVMTDEDTARISKLLPDPIRDNEATAKSKYKYIQQIINTSDPTKARNMVYSGHQATGGTHTSKSGIKFTVE